MALGASAIRAVKRKAARRNLLQADAAFGARELLRKQQFLLVDNIHGDGAGAFAQRGLHRVIQPFFDTRFNYEPIDHNFDRVGFVAIHLNIVCDFIDFTVHPDSYEAFFAHLFDKFTILTFFAANQRREDLYPAALRQRHYRVDHLFNGLLGDLAATLWTVWVSNAGKQQTQVVIYLSNRADGGARVTSCGFLIYRNRRGQASDVFHIRLIHLPKKLARVRA